MSNAIHPSLARLMADLSDAVDSVLAKPGHAGAIDIWAPIGVQITTVDGVTANFLEEGIVFYPEAPA